ncbi:MAG: hypothetical protein K2M48_05990 [Clostridiales bacterium]|nr:hypothetical protein [Clostridiales bacterium]
MEHNCATPGINVPDQLPDFNAPNNVGSWRQLFAANIGKFVKLEIGVQLEGPLRSVCGEIYSVGNSYVSLLNCGKVIVADILAIKFAYFE